MNQADLENYMREMPFLNVLSRPDPVTGARIMNPASIPAQSFRRARCSP